MHTEQIVNLRIMGEFNTTKSGKPCQLWKDLPTVTRNANWVGYIEYNYCKRIEKYGNVFPVFHYDMEDTETCDIPKCGLYYL